MQSQTSRGRNKDDNSNDTKHAQMKRNQGHGLVDSLLKLVEKVGRRNEHRLDNHQFAHVVLIYKDLAQVILIDNNEKHNRGG